MAQQVVLTLFGEEIIPQQVKPEPKPRAEKKTKTKEETSSEAEPKVKAEKVAKTVKEKKEPRERKAPTNPEKLDSEELLQNFEGDKQYYSIGEVSKLFKVNTSHIRFWTNEFKLKVRTTRKGDRLYTTEQIKELKAIYHLVKERGYTIAGAKGKLKEKKKGIIDGVTLKESLVQLRGRLLQIRKELK